MKFIVEIVILHTINKTRMYGEAYTSLFISISSKTPPNLTITFKSHMYLSKDVNLHCKYFCIYTTPKLN